MSVINFVQERQKKLTKTQEADLRFLRNSSIVLVIVFCVYVMSLGVTFYYNSQIKSIQQEQQVKRQAILGKEAIEKSYSIFANKLKVLTDLFQQRKNKQEALAFFSNLFGEHVNITGLNYTSDKEVLSFLLRSKSIFVMEQVFSLLDSQEVVQRYPDISKSGLRRGSDGTYTMSLTVALVEQAFAANSASSQEDAQDIFGDN